MKVFKGLLTIISIVLTIIIIGALMLYFTGVINKDSFETKMVYDSIIEEEFDRIKITTDSLDVKFVKSDDERVNVKVYDRDDSNVSVNVIDGILTIDSENDITNFLVFFGKREVVISLNEKEYNIELTSKSGDILSKINLGKTDIVSTSGDVKLEEVDNLSLTSTSGDVRVNKINKSIDLVSTSGDVFIDELNINVDSSIKTTSGDVRISKIMDDVYINTKTKSGDVSIKDNDRHATYQLTIETTSGDIHVK